MIEKWVASIESLRSTVVSIVGDDMPSAPRHLGPFSDVSCTVCYYCPPLVIPANIAFQSRLNNDSSLKSIRRNQLTSDRRLIVSASMHQFR
ncbi:hypothetical protein TNCV_676151 [Trichonephila clavipes]|nr:hypothetical protein TNCV_676151 [Trichonephila clavipes]